MTIMKQIGTPPAAPRQPAPQGTAIDEIQGAVKNGYRSLLVLGPPGSRRLSCARRALADGGFKVVVMNLGSVGTRDDLDAAVRRITGRKDFYCGMRSLQRQGMRRRLALICHNFDGCARSPFEDRVVYRLWFELRNHCRSPIVVFTATDPDFVGRCVASYESFRSYVRLVSLEPGVWAPGSVNDHMARRAS